MKRVGNLFDAVCDMDNLRLAFHKAQRGKAARTVVIAFRRSLEANLRNLREDLLAGRFSFDGYTRFPAHESFQCDSWMRRGSA